MSDNFNACAQKTIRNLYLSLSHRSWTHFESAIPPPGIYALRINVNASIRIGRLVFESDAILVKMKRRAIRLKMLWGIQIRMFQFIGIIVRCQCIYPSKWKQIRM